MWYLYIRTVKIANIFYALKTKFIKCVSAVFNGFQSVAKQILKIIYFFRSDFSRKRYFFKCFVYLRHATDITIVDHYGLPVNDK